MLCSAVALVGRTALLLESNFVRSGHVIEAALKVVAFPGLDTITKIYESLRSLADVPRPSFISRG